MTRYWQNNEIPSVICSLEPKGGHQHPEHDWTEVQVVPLDALVLDGPLPEVDPERVGHSGYVGLDGPGSALTAPIPLMSSVEFYERAARRNLALAEYVKAHPPIDEAQVQALLTLMGESGALGDADLATALVATGKVHVDTTDGAK